MSIEDSRIRRLPPQEIEGLWRQEVAVNPNLVAILKTHPDAAYRFMMDVLSALHSADSERIAIQILEN